MLLLADEGEQYIAAKNDILRLIKLENLELIDGDSRNLDSVDLVICIGNKSLVKVII